ncbi:MAG: hypothetical protein ACFFB3_12685 [Candidatus Hodarchaeota archaeon]
MSFKTAPNAKKWHSEYVKEIRGFWGEDIFFSFIYHYYLDKFGLLQLLGTCSCKKNCNLLCIAGITYEIDFDEIVEVLRDGDKFFHASDGENEVFESC